MTFPPNAIQVVKSFIKQQPQNSQSATVVVAECAVFLRRACGGDDWKRCAAALFKFLEDNLFDCETLVVILDVYDNPAPHRVMVGQKRAAERSDEVKIVDPSDFMDLDSAPPLPVDKYGNIFTAFSQLLNHRDWRQNVFLPYLTKHLKFPRNSPKLKTMYLYGFPTEGVPGPEAVTSSHFSQSGSSEEDGDFDGPFHKHLMVMGTDGKLHRVHKSLHKEVNFKATEADNMALSWARYYLKKGSDVHLISGDGDLLIGCFATLERLIMEMQEANKVTGDNSLWLKIPSFTAKIVTTKLGEYDVIHAREQIIKQTSGTLSFFCDNYNHEKFESQIPFLFLLFAFLGENDTATPVPYLTAVKISESLADYFKNNGRYPTRPPSTKGKDGFELLPPRPYHHDVFVYFTDHKRAMPQINYPAMISLIQTYGKWAWHNKLAYYPEHHPPQKRPKVVSYGWILTIVQRLDFTLKLFWRDQVVGDVIPDLNERAGYSMDEAGRYCLQAETTDVIEVLEDLYASMPTSMKNEIVC